MSPWASITSAIALGLGANAENLPVGFAYSLRGTPIGLRNNMVIAVLTSIATVLPLQFGGLLRGRLPPALPDVAAGLMLVGIGLAGLWLGGRSAKPNAQERPRGGDPSGRPGIGETVTLAGALSINNVGLGLAGGMAGLDRGSVGASVAAFSVLLIWLGEGLGARMAPSVGARLQRLRVDGNIIIIATGVFIMLGL